MPIEIIGFNYLSIVHCSECGWEMIYDTEDEACREADVHEEMCQARNG